MKSVILKTSLYGLAFITFLVSINYFGDAAKLFHNDYEREILEVLQTGQYATNIANYNERVFQREVVSSNLAQKDLIILGSSRAMFINSSFFEASTVYNSAVNGASIEDLMGIYQMYQTNERQAPQNWLVGIDPWILNDNNQQIRWISLKSEFNEIAAQLGVEGSEASRYGKYKELISLSYFQSSLENLPKVLKGKDAPLGTNTLVNKSNTELIDGALVYREAYRNVDVEKVAKRATTYSSGENIYALQEFNEISVRNQELLESWVDLINRRGQSMGVLLTPYHPIVYAEIEKRYPIVLEVEAYLRSIAKKKKIKIYGSYDPRKFEMGGRYFYDGMHAKEEALHAILERGGFPIPLKQLTNNL